MEGQDVESHQSWTPIGQTSNQLILYHASSHALQVLPHSTPQTPIAGPSRRSLLLPPPSSDRDIESISTRVPLQGQGQGHCPYCSQPLPSSSNLFSTEEDEIGNLNVNENGQGEIPKRYFRVLEEAHSSRPPSPTRAGLRFTSPSVASENENENEDELNERDYPASGYYDRFFREECKLGMGAEGSVFLATHVIGGTVLGTYAVKKIAVGRSKEYLYKMLREVRLLEALRHPNIIPYHHSWIEPTRFSSFGPSITALHVLMMYATAGNLDTYLLTRSHSTQAGTTDLSAGNIADADSLGQLEKTERIKAFKARRQSAVDGKSGKRRKREENRGVLLLGVEEIAKLFGDVVEGLAFLHANSILHLDLKCSNVLLHWEEGKLIPKAMISDFGTSEEMLRGKRERTGHTGTMEYMAPETIVTDASGHWRPSDSHADMWSLGMILHKMLFLHMPYPDTEAYPELMREILAYPGFIPTPDMYQSFERRNIPRDLLVLLSKLAHLVPKERPSAEKVKVGLRGLEKSVRSAGRFTTAGGLVRRFASPFSWGGAGASGDGDKDEIISQGWTSWSGQNQNQTIADSDRLQSYSPVRTIPLALPSPGDGRGPPLSIPVEMREMHRRRSVQSYSALQRRALRGGLRYLRVGLFVLKIISLQPHINPYSVSTSIYIIVFLLVLSLADLLLVPQSRVSLSIGAASVHLGVLVSTSKIS